MHFFVAKLSIFCHHMHSQNDKVTPAPSEIASQFPSPLTFEKLRFVFGKMKLLVTLGYLGIVFYKCPLCF
jgi:hypothetical protein